MCVCGVCSVVGGVGRVLLIVNAYLGGFVEPVGRTLIGLFALWADHCDSIYDLFFAGQMNAEWLPQ